MIGLTSSHSFFFRFFVILLLVSRFSAEDPTARCIPNFYYQTLPLIANETTIFNLDTLFQGYNLQFDTDAKEYKQYITLGDKVKEQAHQIPTMKMTGLKSHHLDRSGNSWGSSFVAVTEDGDKSNVHYGFLYSNATAPVINNVLEVQSSKSTTCFDAVFFKSSGYILIDCAEKLPVKDQRGNSYRNFFKYINIQKGIVQKFEFQNQIFVPFTSIKKRKLELFTEHSMTSENILMLRSYIYSEVDQEHASNTYIDIFMVNEPLDPWIVQIIDRSTLNQKQLHVADISVYLNQIYILDYKKGVHRLGVTGQEQIFIKGFYPAKQFDHFRVYSSNLDSKFELVLSNKDIVYQVDWSDDENPKLINKYSIMPGSTVSQIFINQRFLFIHSSSPSTINPKKIYNYTWVFTRGSRTYTRAFHVFQHASSLNRIDLNADSSYLIVISQQRISNYALDNTILTLKLPKNQDLLDKMMNFTILAQSTQPSTSGSTIKCNLTIQFTLLEDNNRTLWPIGVSPPSFYNANFPGKVQIPLYEYVLGPNITYKIEQFQKGDLKNYKVYQQDQLKLNWVKPLPIKEQQMRFLKTQTINYNSDIDILLIYMQDLKNVTYISQCAPNHQDIQMNCTLAIKEQFEGVINNWATTIFISRLNLQTYHIIAYTTQKHHNRVHVRNLNKRTGQNQIIIQLDEGYAGNITGIQAYGKYLFICLKYYKTIKVYDLQLTADGNDGNIYNIDYEDMAKLGIKYFSPEKVQVSEFFPHVLFIKNVNTIVAIDASVEEKYELLGVVTPVLDTNIQFSFMISLNHLIVTAIPSSVLEYDISRIYLKEMVLTKKYPLYGFKLPKNYDTDVSEYGQATFVTTVSEGGNYQIFVYRPGYPAVATLYDIIDLYTYKPVLIDASGAQIDYITVYSSKQIRVFREYIIPIAEIEVPSKDFKFYIQYQNVVQSTRLEIIQVAIINLPMKITVNPDLIFFHLWFLRQNNDISTLLRVETLLKPS